MKTILTLTIVLMLVSCCALPVGWYDCKGKGLFPYWQTGGDWYTVLSFVNGSEETGDVLHIRFMDVHASGSSDLPPNIYSIRAREMLIFSTTPDVPLWIPTTTDYGYIMFRTDEGGFIHAYCVIYNHITGNGYIVPACHQDHGF